MTTAQIMKNAKEVKKSLSNIKSDQKDRALIYMADALVDNTSAILRANEKDVLSARGKLSESMIDRLTLTESRIKLMADSIREVARLEDPCGKILSTTERPNGLVINKVSVPFGVIAIIYESRPNVTSDAAALCIKSGNACILRSGKDAYNSSAAVADALRSGLKKEGLPEDLIQLVSDTSRESARALMEGVGYIDLLIPRGGAGLIKSCTDNAKVPCIQTGTGICHVFVDESADINMALDIVENAKTDRPSVCNSEEVLLVHENIAKEFLPRLKERIGKKVKLLLSRECLEIIQGEKAGDDDFDTEFLDYVLAIKTVKNVKEAAEHILNHSTGHSEAIVTQNEENATYFTSAVDSAAVYVNASTRFTDGGEFGLGCEMGISTQKLHARGPMGLCELNTYKYIIIGNGQVR